MTTTVPAAAVSKNFGAYQDAAVRAPVIITKNGRPRTVLLAYEDFVRLSKRDRRVQLTAELGANEIAAVEASEMEPDSIPSPSQGADGRALYADGHVRA
ncbi:type II toxin-antitoxin system Phd/YefM family antitoxin [Mesorhizobium sp. M1378]|uniref:type II toxin-antitoxin system Phd/YefM family antitoxin n=1 Tax=Mesorhizobium sp. M1378 TaxID=2957092 RepID=UPI00333734FA